jgi:hypothetical protein
MAVAAASASADAFASSTRCRSVSRRSPGGGAEDGARARFVVEVVRGRAATAVDVAATCVNASVVAAVSGAIVAAGIAVPPHPGSEQVGVFEKFT